jgi:urocanate hydratase
MSKKEELVVAQVAASGWVWWATMTVATSTVNTAASAATRAFLENLLSPAVILTSTLAGYAASAAFSLTVNAAMWGVSSAASGTSYLFKRATTPAAPKSEEWDMMPDGV